MDCIRMHFKSMAAQTLRRGGPCQIRLTPQHSPVFRQDVEGCARNGRWTDLCCCSRSLRPTCGSCACKLSAAARWSARSSSAAYEPRIPRSHYAHASSCERSGPSADVGRDVAFPTRWPQRTSPSERRMIRCLVRQVRMQMPPIWRRCGGVSPALPVADADVAGESPGPGSDVARVRLGPFTSRA